MSGLFAPDSRTRRVRGCAPPFAAEQVAVVALEAAYVALAFVIFALYAERRAPLAVCCGLYGAAALALAACYFYCALVDPAQPGGLACPCMKATQARERYCRLCNKSVPGLDHHCVWLNTCIGARSYWAFYLLATAGSVQFALHIVLCALVAAPGAWRRSDVAVTDGDTAFAAVVACLGAVGLVAFGSLWVFHTYLLTQGIGTYDWMLRRADRANAREEQAALREREAETKRANAAIAAALGNGNGNGSATGGPLVVPPPPLLPTAVAPPSSGEGASGSEPSQLQRPPPAGLLAFSERHRERPPRGIDDEVDSDEDDLSGGKGAVGDAFRLAAYARRDRVTALRRAAGIESGGRAADSRDVDIDIDFDVDAQQEQQLRRFSPRRDMGQGHGPRIWGRDDNGLGESKRDREDSGRRGSGGGFRGGVGGGLARGENAAGGAVGEDAVVRVDAHPALRGAGGTADAAAVAAAALCAPGGAIEAFAEGWEFGDVPRRASMASTAPVAAVSLSQPLAAQPQQQQQQLQLEQRQASHFELTAAIDAGEGSSYDGGTPRTLTVPASTRSVMDAKLESASGKEEKDGAEAGAGAGAGTGAGASALALVIAARGAERSDVARRDSLSGFSTARGSDVGDGEEWGGDGGGGGREDADDADVRI